MDVDHDVDEDDFEITALCKFEHRKTLPYRASKHNATDSHFKSSTSLVYHYLDYVPSSITALDVAGVGGDVDAITDENGGLQKWLSKKVCFNSCIHSFINTYFTDF